MPSRLLLRLLPLIAALSGLAAVGCSPQIGDKCVLNTDCSINGTRQCDTSLPGGYCTIFNCGPNSCPNGNGCYLFYAEVQGCPYDDRSPSRTAHSFCMRGCASDSDCRAGYECADLRVAPWNAILLDDNQNQPACVPIPDQSLTSAGAASPTEAPVCQADPDIDAAFAPEPDSGPVILLDDAGEDAGAEGEGGAGTMIDAGFDATIFDAGTDATLSPDASSTDGGAAPDASDAGAPDALGD